MAQTATASPTPIETTKVTGRRTLRFATLTDCLADAEMLGRSRVRCLGNWSAGQIFQHVATGMNSSIDGAQFKSAWFVRLIMPLFKNRILTKGMSPGFKLPPAAAQVLIPGDTNTQAGLAAIRAAIERLQTESHRAPSPFLGKLTRAESDQLHLRHAELHFSFIVPENS